MMEVTLADRVEALLHLLCEELFDGEEQVRLLVCQSRIAELGLVAPLQYLVCTLDAPQARRALAAALPAWQEALAQLAALLAQADAAWAEDSRGWARFEALLGAPWPVQRPAGPDLRDWDVLLVLERNGRFGGSWEGLMEWLHQQDSRRHQADIQRIRQLQAFEQAHGVDVGKLLGG